MAKQIVASLAAAAIAGACLMACQRARDAVAQRPAAAGQGQGPARVLLNEIVFLPAAGQSRWVELINVGGQTASLDGMQLTSDTGAKFAIPQGQQLSPGAVRIVRFDEQAGADANVIHATPSAFAGPAGFIQLIGASGELDRVAWGSGQPRAVSLSRGGFQDDPTPGMSIGRIPGSVTSDPLEWVSFSPAQTTEGRVNPQPAVEILLPMDGAIVTSDNTNLSWYPAPGATRYRVQLANDQSFASPLFDQTVDQPTATPTLAPGFYVWRVQAIAADGATANYSPTSTLTVRPPRAPVGRGRALLDWLLPRIHAQRRGSPEVTDEELPTVLEVPLIKQHKDTRMLIIESRRESDHGWDSNHGDLNTSDPADNMNCATASIAMLTAFYGGKLSQDRINYEVFKDDAPGPQGDLNWGRGMSARQISRGITYALGHEPVVEVPADEMFTAALFKTRIREQHMPMIGCKNHHCVAIVGSNGSTLVINDPWRGTYLVPARNALNARIFVMATAAEGVTPSSVHAKSDEDEVSNDSDRDGVVDFDETHRFETDPNDKDSDQDELPDKEDIKASVLDPRHGFAFFGNGRDFDGDGKMMELDDDSDDGGCLDGWEDVNKNGKYERERKEMDFFQQNDDPCIKGTLELRNDEAWEVAGSVRTSSTLFGLTRYGVSLRPLDAERWEGRANVKFDSRTTTTTVTPSSHCEENSVTVQKPYVLLLAADGRASPDGRIELNVRLKPGVSPPPLRLVWKNSCSRPQSGAVESPPGPAAWPWPRLTLVNGVYDENTVRQTPPRAGASGSGKWITKVHLEQKRLQP